MPSRGTSTCVYDAELGMFTVTKSKGKSICQGGYGVPHTIQICNTNHEGKSSKKGSTSDYLFIEEALFLHERGMLEVYSQKKEELDTNTTEESKSTQQQQQQQQQQVLMGTQEIYELMLNSVGLSLAVYLTYSHLRSQSYIVLRHTTNRLEIIRTIAEQSILSTRAKEAKEETREVQDTKKQESDDQDTKLQKPEADNEPKQENDDTMTTKTSDEQGKEQEANKSNDWKRKRKHTPLAMLKKELRSDAFHAPMPHLLRYNDSENATNVTTNGNTPALAFDVYTPNSNFRKTMPGLPDFYVAVTAFAEPSPTFSTMKGIIRSCEGIPLKVASVSDGGTISMFGMTDYGVPSIT